MKSNIKKYYLLKLFLLTFATSSCTGSGSSSSTTTGGGDTTSPTTPIASNTQVVPGIGTGGSTYIAGTLDGTWTTGCEGGADGDNWSYTNTMTISGTTFSTQGYWYRNNQTCTGSPDVSSLESATMSWGSYDTTGFSSDAVYSNKSTLITVLTANGMSRMGNIGSCTILSYVLNTPVQCANVLSGSAKYYLADNIFLPEVQGPQLYSTSRGISYAFGTYRKILSTPSSIDGIYAATNAATFTKLMISGDRYAYISADDVSSDRVFVVSGSLSEQTSVSIPVGASSFVATVKSKIWQPRLASGATELNTASPPACGFSDYANGVVKNLLLSGTCTSSPSHLMYKITGNAMQFTFSNLPLPSNFSSGVTVYAPWKYSP